MSLDLTGFTNLVTVNCSNAGITGTLNVSGLASLTSLDCNTNGGMTALTLTGCTALVALDCSNNAGMTVLTVTGCTGMTSLTSNLCFALGTINDLDDCINLVTVNLDNCNLATLAIATLVNATSIECRNNDLTELDASGLSLLQTLACDSNLIGPPNGLKLTGCTGLVTLSCASCSLTTLDVSTCTILDAIDFDTNPGLTSVDVSTCSVLRDIEGYACSLTSLNIGTSPNFTVIDVSGNALPDTPNGVNECLINLENNCLGNFGTVYTDGGTNSAPTGAGATAATNLATAGWSVNTN